MRSTYICISILLSLSTSARAADIVVVPGQSIQAAIAAASAGDRVLVQPGTYPEAIDFLGKKIEVIGVGGAPATTIDATGLNSSVVKMNGFGANGAILRGFRLTGGVGTLTGAGANRAGGGIFATAAVVIEECVIEINHVAVGGGGGASLTGSASMRRCIVRGNSAPYGGGLIGGTIEYTRIEGNAGGGVSSPSSLRNSLVIGNVGPGAVATFAFNSFCIERSKFIGNTGSGVQCSTSQMGFLLGCVRSSFFEGNQEGGVHLEQISASWSGVLLDSCVFRNNVATGPGSGAVLIGKDGNGGGSALVYSCVFDGDSLAAPHALTVFGSIFLNHPNPVSSPAPLLASSISSVPLSGTINVNPQFVDAVAGDYHLTAGSPAIDAGAAGQPTDFEGDAFVGTPDIGVDEFAPHVYLHGDATAGANVHLRVIGKPGDGAILFLSPTLAAAPIATPFGAFGLGFPIFFDQPFALGVVPANGVIDIPGTIPGNAPLFATLHAQVLLQSGATGVLTNVETIVIL